MACGMMMMGSGSQTTTSTQTVLDKDDDENVFNRGEILAGTEAYGSAAAAITFIKQRGCSNIRLVNLIAAQRNFQANAKALDTASQISQTIIPIKSAP